MTMALSGVHYNYVDTPNSNLVCCICRTPFIEPTTIKTCTHTFCGNCISSSLEHSSLCPVDRSSVTTNDLVPASIIIRNLVDELIVECSNRSLGCTHTCQRQLLDSHLQDACGFVEIECPSAGCNKSLLRKDLKLKSPGQDCPHQMIECEICEQTIPSVEIVTHKSDCASAIVNCQYCSSPFPRASRATHESSCDEAPVSCLQSSNGCPWTGPRESLAIHTETCPYTAIKGFFDLYAALKYDNGALREENALLKRKVEAMDGMIHAMRREMHAVRSAIGPWLRTEPFGQSSNNGIDQGVPSVSDYTPFPEALSRSTSGTIGSPSRRSHRPSLSIDAHYFGSNQSYDDALASFFPPTGSSPPAASPYPSTPSYTLSSNTVDSAILSSVAPLNLNTSLEGTLTSLRDSIVTLSAAVDSLTRQQDIAMSSESQRVNEELRALKNAINFQRMQVHRIMMDRNAQVTGRAADVGDDSGFFGPPVNVPPIPPPPHPFFFPSASSQPFTKL